jgi:hypothetical protein
MMGGASARFLSGVGTALEHGPLRLGGQPSVGIDP